MVTGAACGGGDTGSGGGSSSNNGGSGGGNGGSTVTVNPSNTGSATTNPSNTGSSTSSSMDCGGGIMFMPAACQTCADNKCCAETKVCDQGSDCLTYLSCIQNATTQDEFDACATATPKGKTDLDAVDACLQKDCQTECMLSSCTGDGLDWDAAFQTGDDTFAECTKCDQDKCCAQFTALTTDLQACGGMDPCPANDATNACIDDLTDAACTGSAKDAITCQEKNCTDECFAGVCDAGVIGGTTCAVCEGKSCCTEFEAMGCGTMDPACQGHLDALNDCTANGMASAKCMADPIGQAAAQCVVDKCDTECMPKH